MRNQEIINGLLIFKCSCITDNLTEWPNIKKQNKKTCLYNSFYPKSNVNGCPETGVSRPMTPKEAVGMDGVKDGTSEKDGAKMTT